MGEKLDFIIHWLWTVAYILLIISGIAMIGAKYGWILNYKIAGADITHRICATLFVVLSCISIFYEIFRIIIKDTRKLAWGLFGNNGYKLFTFLTSLIFIITGVIIWVCMDSFETGAAFALFIHEKLTYIAVASVIWHIYVKCHSLMFSTKNLKKV